MDLPLRWTLSGVSLAIFVLGVAGLIAFGASQASASHVSCGDEITADTTLDSDLIDCPNNGIVIGADNIKLDLNGHRIDGDGTEFADCPKNEICDVGVLNDRHDGVKVKGGSTREFGVGVLLARSRQPGGGHLLVEERLLRRDGRRLIAKRGPRQLVEQQRRSGGRRDRFVWLRSHRDR